jgi:hypothetical protein
LSTAQSCQLCDAASGWERLDFRVEAAFTRADLARNLRAAGDPGAKPATEHADSLRRELGIVPLDQHQRLASGTTRREAR